MRPPTLLLALLLVAVPVPGAATAATARGAPPDSLDALAGPPSNRFT